MKIAFLGLGRMGSELVAHVAAAGHDVTVWNRSPEAVTRVAVNGITGAATAASAVDGADAVVTVLFGPDAVRETVLNGDLNLSSGTTWIDITTVSPADAEQFEQWALARGVEYVHSPVIGSLAPARARALGVLVGGSARGIEAALPIVSLWADPERLHVADTPGKAAARKLVANLALATSMQALTEALSLGEAGGLTADEVFEQLLEKTALQPIATMKGDVVRAGDFDDAQFSANALAKDVRLMIHTAAMPLPALTAAYVALEAAKADGLGESDFAVIARGLAQKDRD